MERFIDTEIWKELIELSEDEEKTKLLEETEDDVKKLLDKYYIPYQEAFKRLS